MRDIRIATAQFEHRDNDKAYNLSRIDALTAKAVADPRNRAEIVCFHECSISGYTFLQHLSRDEMTALAEPVPHGPSTEALCNIAKKHDVVVMAGLVEVDDDGKLYNTYVTVSPTDGYVTKFRKLHPFVSPHLSSGEGFHVVELLGVKVGFLICYDNNLPENARVTALMGAEVIVAPHVTMCTPSNMPGRGPVDRALWDNRAADPDTLRGEFDGPKGRGWLMRWLPARAWENGVFIVFANPIGVDGDTIKPGLSMVIDAFGEVIAEARTFEDDVVVAECKAEVYDAASGRRYHRARRPELYARLTEPHPPGHEPVTAPGWALAKPDDA